MTGRTRSLPRLFVGSSVESLHLAQALQANLEAVAEVRVWNQDLFQTGHSALEDLLRLVEDFDYAAFIWSTDDTLVSRGESYLTARDNVILEAGMFYGVLGKERVFLVVPHSGKPKVPSDLAGITQLTFREPSDGNYSAALGPTCRSIEQRIKSAGHRQGSPTRSVAEDQLACVPTLFNNVKDAWAAMKADCNEAQTIAILGIRGLAEFGTDQSLVSLAEMHRTGNLRKLRIVLLSDQSRWLTTGFIQLRAYESIETFKKELRATHEIVESAMLKFGRMQHTTKSGVRYHLGEPHFGMIITDKAAYVKTYAEPPAVQVVDLPIYRFVKSRGSLYGAFKRYFDDLWHNGSVPGTFQKDYIDLETSAGGIVLREEAGKKYAVLLRRHDGYWVLPKGHRMVSDRNLEETALREVCEETGLGREGLTIERFLGYYSYDETTERLGVTKVVHLYLMRCTTSVLPLASPDFAEAAWWDISLPLPEMLYTYQKSYLHEVREAETC